jgi:hypothetical protein
VTTLTTRTFPILGQRAPKSAQVLDRHCRTSRQRNVAVKSLSLSALARSANLRVLDILTIYGWDLDCIDSSSLPCVTRNRCRSWRIQLFRSTKPKSREVPLLEACGSHVSLNNFKLLEEKESRLNRGTFCRAVESALTSGADRATIEPGKPRAGYSILNDALCLYDLVDW